MAAMSESVVPIAEGIRREDRCEGIRVVEYSRFPRMAPHAQLRLGFTRDFASWGMCLGVDEPEPVGTLIRLRVRDVAGRPDEFCVGRVVWKEAARDGRTWLGIELLVSATRTSERSGEGYVDAEPDRASA